MGSVRPAGCPGVRMLEFGGLVGLLSTRVKLCTMTALK